METFRRIGSLRNPSFRKKKSDYFITKKSDQTFNFSLKVSEASVIATNLHKFMPEKLNLKVSRKKETFFSDSATWEPSLKQPSLGTCVWHPDFEFSFNISAPKSKRIIQRKDLHFVLTNSSPSGQKILAEGVLNLADFTFLQFNDKLKELKLILRPKTSKILSAQISFSIERIPDETDKFWMSVEKLHEQLFDGIMASSEKRHKKMKRSSKSIKSLKSLFSSKSEAKLYKKLESQINILPSILESDGFFIEKEPESGIKSKKLPTTQSIYRDHEELLLLSDDLDNDVDEGIHSTHKDIVIQETLIDETISDIKSKLEQLSVNSDQENTLIKQLLEAMDKKNDLNATMNLTVFEDHFIIGQLERF